MLFQTIGMIPFCGRRTGSKDSKQRRIIAGIIDLLFVPESKEPTCARILYGCTRGCTRGCTILKTRIRTVMLPC